MPDTRATHTDEGGRNVRELVRAFGATVGVNKEDEGSEPDNVLVRRSWDQPQIFALIFDRHASTIHAYAARRAGRPVADDVMAETFLIAFERRRSFDVDRTSARPWLYGIASNLLGRHARQEERQWRAYARHAGDAGSVEHESGAVARLDAARALAQMSAVVRRLDVVDRDVLLLYAWADLTYDQIAQALNLPVGTVRSKLHRVRTRLREHVDAANPDLMEVYHG